MPTIDVLEQGRLISCSFEDMMRYDGPGSPGGVAHAFKVMERAWPILAGGEEPPERREIAVTTAFGGPGARDAFELVTRAVTGDRYVTDEFIDLARAERPTAEQATRLAVLKREMAERLMATPAAEVYDLADG